MKLKIIKQKNFGLIETIKKIQIILIINFNGKVIMEFFKEYSYF